ncbi:glycosyltransferase family 39 protein [Halorubrum ezzemoulense]|uniref:Glycosyltransferase RgtA/B/C/D-like domain-containing protein n=1 Tax=Halorubrum ezzemoulense TaxID=337243 RepID=A0A256K3K6_HALEZ|nr:glycosyltransferase family 39 protein [Halorubrum ezzemoulense]OYR75719.1 hypothetical protein DJ76_01745 [Halorubrum ezzemoulense]
MPSVKANNVLVSRIIRYLRYTPVVFVIPLLTRPIAIRYSPAREFAGYFQALSFLRDPITSFSYVVLQESDASLHLSSMVAAPIIGLGYYEAGRLVSLLAAILASVAIASIATDIFDNRAGLLAPVLLWANPYFIRYTWGIFPEAVSICLTSAALATMIKYNNSGNDQWYWASLSLAVLAVFNHGWEAIILLPLIVILLINREWGRATRTSITIIASLGFVTAITSLQSLPANTMQYAVWNTGVGIYPTEDWLGRWLDVSFIPFLFAFRTHMYITVPALIIWTWKARNFSTSACVMLGLFISGLSIPVLLPGGVNHAYYLWALILPVTLTAAAALSWIIQLTGDTLRSVDVQSITIGVIICCVVASGGYILIFEGSIGASGPANTNFATPAGSPTDDIRAGEKLQNIGVETRHDVVFVGDWDANASFVSVYREGAPRIFVYSKVPMRGTWHWGAVPGAKPTSPTLLNSTDAVNRSTCKAIIKKSGDSVHVESC